MLRLQRRIARCVSPQTSTGPGEKTHNGKTPATRIAPSDAPPQRHPACNLAPTLSSGTSAAISAIEADAAAASSALRCSMSVPRLSSFRIPGPKQENTLAQIGRARADLGQLWAQQEDTLSVNSGAMLVDSGPTLVEFGRFRAKFTCARTSVGQCRQKSRAGLGTPMPKRIPPCRKSGGRGSGALVSEKRGGHQSKRKGEGGNCTTGCQKRRAGRPWCHLGRHLAVACLTESDGGGHDAMLSTKERNRLLLLRRASTRLTSWQVCRHRGFRHRTASVARLSSGAWAM